MLVKLDGSYICSNEVAPCNIPNGMLYMDSGKVT